MSFHPGHLFALVSWNHKSVMNIFACTVEGSECNFSYFHLKGVCGYQQTQRASCPRQDYNSGSPGLWPGTFNYYTKRLATPHVNIHKIASPLSQAELLVLLWTQLSYFLGNTVILKWFATTFFQHVFRLLNPVCSPEVSWQSPTQLLFKFDHA